MPMDRAYLSKQCGTNVLGRVETIADKYAVWLCGVKHIVRLESKAPMPVGELGDFTTDTGEIC